MMGANVVHMTMLQELVAHGVGIPVGKYRVFTNNLHVYPDGMPNFDKVWTTPLQHDPYNSYLLTPLLQPDEEYQSLLLDCAGIVNMTKAGLQPEPRTYFARNVIMPIRAAWDARKGLLGDGKKEAEQIVAQDWRRACLEWLNRRT
jgi:hypothetical protein